MLLSSICLSVNLKAADCKLDIDTIVVIDLRNASEKKTVESQTNVLNNKAKAIFNDVKSKLSVNDKNDIADQLKVIIFNSKKGKLEINMNEDGNNQAEATQEDDFSPSFNITVYVTDINKDNKEEVYIMLSSQMLQGTESPPYVYVFNKINSKYQLVLETSAFAININQNSKSQFPELCFADEFKWINSKSPVPGSLMIWNGTKYTNSKKPYPTGFKWINADLAKKRYESSF